MRLQKYIHEVTVVYIPSLIQTCLPGVENVTHCRNRELVILNQLQSLQLVLSVAYKCVHNYIPTWWSI